MIIGLTGKKQVGKDTAADYICKKYSLTKLSFADPLRELGRIFYFTEHEMTIDKDAVNKVWNMSWRKFAQSVGTDLFRNTFNTQTWVILMMQKLREKNDVVIPDVRFDNEAMLIKMLGGAVIKIESDTGLSDSHSSEQGINMRYVDYTVINNGTITEFLIKIDEVINDSNRKS